MSTVNLKNMPHAASALSETKKFFAEAQTPDDDREVLLDDAERSVDGMIELGLEHIELQRALHLDYMYSIRDVPRSELEDQMAKKFVEINASRTDPIDVTTIDEHILRRLSEPNWLEVTAGELGSQPDYIQEAAGYLQEVDAKLAILSQDDHLREGAHEHFKEKMEIAKVAHAVMRGERRQDTLGKQISTIYQRVAESGRQLTTVDHRKIERLEQQLQAVSVDEHLAQLSPDKLPDLTGELNRLIRKENHRQLENGLLLTPDTQATIDAVLPSLVAGRPALFVGETGGAKTALAEAIARQFMGKEPELVSFHGEINVYQLMGKDRLKDNETGFSPGPVVRAMEEGRPLILDEINAAPAELLKRLNVIMQLRPGDTFTIQEDSGKQVVVRSGFCIMATANEKSSRYKGVDVMSTELKNRFGANVRRITYPDSDVVFGQTPPDNLALAEAALTDDIGEFATQLPDGQLEAFVRAAHASQRIFTGEYGTGKGADDLKAGFVPNERIADNKPGLDDTVLSPRMMVAILQQVRDGMGRVQLTDVLNNWVNGIEKPSDRAVMTNLLDAHTSGDGVTLLGKQTQSREGE